MRELKFRAWDGKEMKPAFDLTQNPKFWWEENKDYPLMQYTALKDKNGKDIYEGDISWDGWNECYGVVRFDEGKFIYEWSNVCEDLSEVHDYLDIVGNIYENPKLLEGDTD